MTNNEKIFEDKLKELVKQQEWIELSLHPKEGTTIVFAPLNQARINEGRLGKFDNISEPFYDKMVELYHHKHYK